MNIQFCLEAESQETGIQYPSIEAHKTKDGHGNESVQCVEDVTEEKLAETIMKSKEEAQEKIKELGMKEVLDKNKCWENPPTPLIDEADLNDADDDEDEEEKGMSQSKMGELLQEVNSSEDEKAVASDISNLFCWRYFCKRKGQLDFNAQNSI